MDAWSPQAIWRRVLAGLKRWPKAQDWQLTAIVFALFGVCAWTTGFATGLYRFELQLDADLLRVALVAFFVPAIGEEVAFRAALIPLQANKRPTLWASGLALVVFLAWHPINAALFFPSVLPYFSDWRFLSVTAMLGLACSYLWLKTGSLWPPVIVHWLAVVVWKAALGAPRLL